jgi:hypothetical protein
MFGSRLTCPLPGRKRSAGEPQRPDSIGCLNMVRPLLHRRIISGHSRVYPLEP